jgi:hypothetical protein
MPSPLTIRLPQNMGFTIRYLPPLSVATWQINQLCLLLVGEIVADLSFT